MLSDRTILADLIRCCDRTIAALACADVTELWHLMVLVVFYGLGQALFQPRVHRDRPEIIPREELLQANCWEPLGMRFFGPALEGC